MLLFIKKKEKKGEHYASVRNKNTEKCYYLEEGRGKWRGVPNSVLFFIQRSLDYQSLFCKRFQISDSNLNIHKLILKRLH